jgi:HSP20 family protein
MHSSQSARPDGDVERFFEQFFSHRNLFSSIPHSIWSPPTDVYETGAEYIVRVELPGIQKDDQLSIELNHNVLTLRGHRHDHCTEAKKSFLQMEIHYGYFEKVITLPHGINPDVPPATYRDGFLCIRIRKSQQRRRTRCRIRIES